MLGALRRRAAGNAHRLRPEARPVERQTVDDHRTRPRIPAGEPFRERQLVAGRRVEPLVERADHLLVAAPTPRSRDRSHARFQSSSPPCSQSERSLADRRRPVPDRNRPPRYPLGATSSHVNERQGNETAGSTARMRPDLKRRLPRRDVIEADRAEPRALARAGQWYRETRRRTRSARHPCRRGELAPSDIPAGRTRSSDRALPHWSNSRSRWRAVPFGSIDVASRASRTTPASRKGTSGSVESSSRAPGSLNANA